MTHWHRKPEGRLKDFGLFHAKGVATIAQALADGKLKRWDPTVLWLLLPHLKFPVSNGDAPLEANHHPEGEPDRGSFLPAEQATPAGRIRVSLAELAAQIGQPREEVFRAVARLQAAGFLVRCRDREGPYLLLNPALLTVGGKRTRDRLWREFSEARAESAQAHGSAAPSPAGVAA
jgi:biotin operon repressor